VKYGFVRSQEGLHPVRTLCRVLDVHPSGYYAWRRSPLSARALEDRRQTSLIKQSWLESGGVYGHRKVLLDLRDLGESCGKHRVRRLMNLEGLRAEVGYRRRRTIYGGKPSTVAPNTLARQFNPEGPDQAWVTDITMIRTHEGWLYLAVVLDLYSRCVIGWSMGARITADLVLDALLMAIWRRKPGLGVLIHSDQGSQYTSDDWRKFAEAHGLNRSMSRRGNCHDNAVAESFFQLLKRERIRRKIYPTRKAARADVFDYIEVFYNKQRRHGSNDGLSPVAFEQRENKGLESV
jgi:putative transposase